MFGKALAANPISILKVVPLPVEPPTLAVVNKNSLFDRQPNKGW